MERAVIPVPSGGMRALIASPRVEGPRPAVIVLHELYGQTANLRDKAQRFADMGYVALAPNLYSTRGPKLICIARTVRGIGRVTGGVSADLEACREWLALRPEVDPSRIGVAGFCMTGEAALLFAARSKVNVAATFYGCVPRSPSALQGICPVVAGYGEKDCAFRRFGPRLTRHLEGLEVTHDIVMYRGARHGFLNRRPELLTKLTLGLKRPSYHAEAAEDSWRRIEAFFATHLGSQEPPAKQD